MLGNIWLLFLLPWPSSGASLLAAEDNTTYAVNHLRVKRAAAAIGNVIAGVSFGGQSATAIASSLDAAGYTVATVIQVENHTKWKLVNGQSWTKWGHIIGAPHSIRPGYKEVLKTHKTKGTVVGSAGVLYYKFEGLNEYLAVVWHAPYNFNHLSNYLAIGLYNQNDFDEFRSYRQGYNRMRNHQTTTMVGDPTWRGCSDLYYYRTNVCKTYSPSVEVHGTMGTSHHPVITIKVFARRSKNRAPESPLYPSSHVG